MSFSENTLVRSGISAHSAPAGAGDNTVLAVAASKRFKLLSAVVSASGGANNVSLKVGATIFVPLVNLGAGAFYVLPYNPAGWANGVLGDDFIANLSAATAVGIGYTYFLWDS